MKKIRSYHNRIRYLLLSAFLLVVLILSIAGYSVYTAITKPNDPPSVVVEGGIHYHARAGDDYLQIFQDGEWNDFLIKGVNMGIAKPGHFPGEAAITKDEYARWFKQIGEMNANVIRIYTIHPPVFYEAFLEYNQRAKQPLYLMHGVWIEEEKLVETGDAFLPENKEEFLHEIKRTIDLVHGNLTLPERRGHASGSYTANISHYMLSYVLGIEWDSEMVVNTNEANPEKPRYDGKYFHTAASASPFEAWLASVMDETVRYETEVYGWQRPISFTNWVTTDPLTHPAEPIQKEDLVSVDPNHILAKETQLPGQFASYHIYPYYPDFMNLQRKYTEFIDHRGERNNYAGYLRDMKEAHSMPILVAEFGVPGSRGLTHRNISGWDQGFHSETAQGNINVRLFEDIVYERMAGGLIFTWQDEWFKRTWNTMDFDDPDRRPFWSNIQTNEQYFGLLSFDPGEKEMMIKLDGQGKDWDKAKIPANKPDLNHPAIRYEDGEDDSRLLKDVRITSDARYVYFLIETNEGRTGGGWNWDSSHVMILLDTIPDQGQHKVPGGGSWQSEAGIDFIIDLKGPDNSRMWVDSYYDSHYYMYAELLDMIDKQDYASAKNNGVFHPIRLTLNKEITIPGGEDAGKVIPFEDYETGVLRFGIGDPKHADYDSLADVAVSKNSSSIEIRIPWQMLNVKDPSTKQIISDMWKEGLESSQLIQGFKAAVVTYKPDSADNVKQPGGSFIAHSIPSLTSGVISADNMINYEWDEWEYPIWHERLKQSYYIVQEAFRTIHLEAAAHE